MGETVHARALVASADEVLQRLAAVPDAAVPNVVSADALARMRRLHQPAARSGFLAARIAATWLLREVTGRPAASIRQRCPSCGGIDHGRPIVTGAPGWQVSWSRRPGLVAAAVAPGPIGIDIEHRASRVPAELGTGNQTEDLVGWTRAEALVKAGATDLDTILEDLPAGPPCPTGLRWPGFDAWRLTDRVAPGWIVSVACVQPVSWSYLASRGSGAASRRVL